MSVITICVNVGPKRSVVKCDSKATTIAQFQEMAFNALGLPLRSSDNTKTELYLDCSPQPRRPILPAHLSDTEMIKIQQQSLYDCGVRHQDRIIVVVTVESAGKVKDSTLSQQQSPQHQQQQQQQQRSRRKAAIAATEAFAATIQQQDEQMMTIALKASPAKRTAISKKTSNNNIKKNNTSRHFANLERIARTASCTNEVTGGRRLRDGAIATSPRRKRTKTGVSNSSTMNRGSDIVEGLVAATTDTSSSSSSARLMRKGWRQAVESAYEQNQANARVAASQGITTMVEFTMANANTNESQQQQQQQLSVAYKKGVQGRGVYTDVVDFIHYDVLVATISEIHPSEALRSFHLALLSPRVFWSLLYHYKNHIITTDNIIQDQSDVVQSSLQWCCPNLDWAYLRRRPEKLSEKAKENLRQKEEQSNPTSSMDWEAAAAAIMSVEQAMDGMVVLTNDGTTGTYQCISALDSDNDDWKLFMETNFELIELIECITSYETDTPSETDDREGDFYPLNHVVYALTRKLEIRNCFELADISNSPLQLNDRLTKVLSEVDNKDIPYLIPDDEKNDSVQITLAAIEQWIESAQETIAHCSLISICDNDSTIVEILTDTLRCSTPRDLIIWESVPSLCIDQVRSRWRDVAASEDMSPTEMDEWERVIEEKITETNIQTWCRRAHIALGQVEWLNDYVTPIEFD